MLYSLNDSDCIALATCEAATVPPQDRELHHIAILTVLRLVIKCLN